METINTQIHDRLSSLREIMKQNNYQAVIIPHSDAHDNEYLAESDERLAFISGFTGSNGLAVVTEKEAFCWTDGRYFIQCEKELFPGWTMKKMARGEETSREFLSKNLKKGDRVGVNFSLLSSSTFQLYQSSLEGIEIVNTEQDLVDKIWGTSKPAYKKDKVIIHELKYTGEECKEKYDRIYKTFQSKNKIPKNKKPINNKYAFVISRLDEIAWMTSLRGQDIEYNPVFFSYAILYYDENSKSGNVHLFSNKEKFECNEIQEHLKKNSISLFPYEDFFKRLNKLSDLSSEEAEKFRDYFLISDTDSLNQYISDMIKKSEMPYYLDELSFVEHTKCFKNAIEIKGIKDCHIRDGAALVRYFAWLEDELINKNSQINEYDAARKSAQFRSEGALFKGESFECISSTGANAAIIHYKPDKETAAIISKDQVYLCDSGAQYLDGTTDTTRTCYFNDENSKERVKEKEMYTRVLLGNLAIERSIFMKRWNISGKNIDSLARHYLWQIGEDYLHGTGHGVGHFLNVHEGPNGIGGYPNNPPFEKGMITSNEPGYYLKDHFGIRIENIISVEEVDGKPDYLTFANMTMVPYENNLLDLNLLSNDYIDYINKYHDECYRKLAPLLEEYKDYVALKYLKKKTSPIQKAKFI